MPIGLEILDSGKFMCVELSSFIKYVSYLETCYGRLFDANLSQDEDNSQRTSSKSDSSRQLSNRLYYLI